jgi:hypothetical protein
LLASRTNLTVSENRLLFRRLSELPSTNQLGIADIRLRLRPEERSNIVAGVLQRVDERTSPSELQQVGNWLATHEAVAELLTVFTPERVAGKPVLQAARWQALIEVGRRDELAPLLESPPADMPPFLVHCLRASAACHEKRTQATVAHLEQAVLAAGTQPGANYFIARFAERVQQPGIALKQWTALALNSAGALPAATEVLRLARLVDDLPAAQPTMSHMRDLMPNEVGVALTAGYLEGLLGKTRPETLLNLRHYAQTNSANFNVLATLGLYEWKSGDAVAALKIMEGASLDWSQADSRSQAVYIGVLGAAGQREAARLQASRLHLETLGREERALVDAWR